MTAYGFNSSTTMTYIIMGIVVLLLAFFGFAVGGVGIIMIIVGVWQTKATPLRIYEDYIEVKLAPVQPMRRIALDEIESLETTPKKIVIRAPVNGGASKRVALPLSCWGSSCC